MAEQHTPSKADAKKAETAADQVIAAFSQALDTAFETEIEYIIEQLRKNRDLTHCLSGMLKADTLQALLDGRLCMEQGPPSGAQPEKGRHITRLGTTTLRSEHLKSQPSVVLRILRRLLPNHFPEGARVDRIASLAAMISYLCSDDRAISFKHDLILDQCLNNNLIRCASAAADSCGAQPDVACSSTTRRVHDLSIFMMYWTSFELI